MRVRIPEIVLVCFVASVGTATLADELSFSEDEGVADAVLDEVRGGFHAPSNLHASLTLVRVAYVNGELIDSRSATIPDIGNMTVDQAKALAEVTGTLVIQNGPDNVFDVASLGPAATVIQNTLNDQHLVTLTTLSVEVNSLAAFREMNFQDGLRDSMITTPGVR